MTWVTNEMDDVTRMHFMLDNGKAWDIHYNTSARVQRKQKQKKGLQKTVSSGKKITVPLDFNEAIGGAFTRGGSLNSNYRELITAVDFEPKSIYGNGTIYWQDEKMNTGTEGMVKLVRAQSDAAMKKPFLHLARKGFGSGTDTSEEIMGIETICSETTSTDCGGKSENDIEDANGLKPWEGKTTTTAQVISPANVRAQILRATWKDGADGYPGVAYMSRNLFNAFKDQLQPLQNLTEDKEMTKAGFHNIVFDGVTFIPDDFITSSSTGGYCFVENENTIGFAVYEGANMTIVPWESTHVAGVMAKTMKVLWMGEQVTSNRQANCLHTGYTLS
jgi:hypothetical protein